MAIRTKEEIMLEIKKLVGENQSDETISLVEDISDTLDQSSKSEEWKAKFEENDKAWRQKYKDRFFSATAKGDPDNDEEAEKKPVKFDELFKEV